MHQTNVLLFIAGPASCIFSLNCIYIWWHKYLMWYFSRFHLHRGSLMWSVSCCFIKPWFLSAQFFLTFIWHTVEFLPKPSGKYCLSKTISKLQDIQRCSEKKYSTHQRTCLHTLVLYLWSVWSLVKATVKKGKKKKGKSSRSDTQPPWHFTHR